MTATPKNDVTSRYLAAVEELVAMRRLTSPSELMLRMGKSVTTWPNLVRGRQAVTVEMLQHLCENFGVEATFLLTGAGRPFPEDHSTRAVRLHKHGEKLLDYGNRSLQVLTVPVDMRQEEAVAVVPEFALGGYTEGYADPDFIRELPFETVPEDLRGRGTIRKFQVYGDSMEPTFTHGDYLYCSYVELGQRDELWNKIRNEYVYVVNSTRGLFLKRVYYHYGDSFLQLYSDKYKLTQDRKYAAFPLPLDEIRELWYFRRRYTAQAPEPRTDTSEIIDMKREMFGLKEKMAELGKMVGKKK